MFSELVGVGRDLDKVFRAEARVGNPLKWALLLVSLIVFALSGAMQPSLGGGWPPAAVLASVFGVSNLLLTLAFLPSARTRWKLPQLSVRARRALISVSYLSDHIYVAVLVALTGGYRSDYYLLFSLLAIKAAIYYPHLRELPLITFFSGIFWVAAAYLQAQSLFFLTDFGFLSRYALTGLIIIGCLVVGWVMERRQRRIQSLDGDLSVKSRDLDEQARAMQRTAGQLANRLLELRSLQESVRAINSTLALDELLQLVVANASRVLHGARCAIGLVDHQTQAVVTRAASGVSSADLWGTSFQLGEGVAGWVVENQKRALIDWVGSDWRFRRIGDSSVASMVCVPLISEGKVLGTLTATSIDRAAFSEADGNLLDIFGDQAVMAVRKASLYEQLLRQEKQTANLYRSVLEKSNELEAVLRGIGDGVIVLDPDLCVLMMNPVAMRFLQLLQLPRPGTRLPAIVPNDNLILLARDTLRDTQKPIIREIPNAEAGGRSRIYQALSSAVMGVEKQVRGVVIVMRDITSQKEIEQMKSDFLSVVSHELRTPLHSIKGFVEIILMGKTGEISPLQRDFLTTVKDSTTNLQQLINDLLEFSRMEAGQVKLKPKPMSMRTVVHTVVVRLQPLAQEGDLSLHNLVPEDLDMIEADPMRIDQVVTNLVTNAIKFTPAQGSVTISAQDLGEMVRVAVTDTGIGIAEEEQAKVFDRFYQVDGSATRSYRGTGLGLTICKFIVEYHRGRIWVESAPDRGSRFIFELPKVLPSDQDLVIDFTVPAADRERSD